MEKVLELKWQKFSSLDCLVKKKPNSQTAVVLIHGFGADAYDLASLMDYLLVPNASWYFPNGILSVPFGGGYEGRAWFPISIANKLQEVLLTGDWSLLEDYEPQGLEEAFESMNQFLKEISEGYENLILGGFSQGAMLALEVFLRNSQCPRKLLLFSGTLFASKRWRELARQKQGFFFFQAHGTEDAILPYSAAKRLNQILNEAGMQGELVTFEDGHTIPPIVIEKANEYLRL